MERSKLSVDHWVAAAPKPKVGGVKLGLSKAAEWRLLIVSLLAADFALIGIAFRLAYAIRFEMNIPIFRLGVVPNLDFYEVFSLTTIPIWILIFWIFGLYTRENLLGGIKEYDLIFRATTFVILLIVFGGFLEVFVLSRGWLVVVWLCTLLLLILGRLLIRRIVYALRHRGFFLTPALIIGANDEGQVLGEQLSRWRTSGLYLIGFIDEHLPPGTPVFEDMKVLGNLEMIDPIISRYKVSELVLATSALNREQMLQIFRSHGLSDEVNLRLSSGLFEIITTGLQVRELAYVPLVQVNKVRLSGVNEVLKFLLDLSIAIPVLIVLFPFLAALAIAIRLDSPGPILHRRRVMGLNGTQFYAYKFRTMHTHGDEILAQHPELVEELAKTHKLKVDPRITRVGAFMRKFSLDELPQLINVLRREMSLVGPRMISPPEMEQYNKWGINLLTVRPGMTGLWQVSGRSTLSYEKRVRLDMYYIRNWSIWLDLYLLIQTFPAVIRQTGAY